MITRTVVFLGALTLAGTANAEDKPSTGSESVKTITAAYTFVIRECDNVANQSALKALNAVANQPRTEKEKAQLVSTIRNGLMQLCLMAIAADLSKYAEGLDVLTKTGTEK